MCRYYELLNNCRHVDRSLIRCRKCPGDPPEVQRIVGNYMLCIECYARIANPDWLNRIRKRVGDFVLPNPPEKRADFDKLWAGIYRVMDFYAHNKIDGTAPFSIDLIKKEDRSWLTSHLDWLQSSILHEDVKSTVQHHLIIIDIMYLIRHNKIHLVHSMYLAEQAAKPQLLIPANIAELDDNHKKCGVCHKDFTPQMKPVHFPCHHTHVMCEVSAMHAVKSGAKCPYCQASFDVANYRRLEEYFDWPKDEDIVTPLWITKLREALD